jgi:hypothetical protein
VKIIGQTVENTNPWRHAAMIGLWAGLIWGAVRFIQFYFQFTKVPVYFLIKPWGTKTFLKSYYGSLTGWLAFIVLSMVAAFIYTAFFRKVKGPWLGLAYGVAWWALLFVWIGPWTGMTSGLGRLEWTSIITDFCLFLIWGLFIGFSISFEFTDERQREPSTA